MLVSIVHEFLDASLLCDSCLPVAVITTLTTTAPPVESYIHQFARPPSRDTRKSQPILPHTPRQQHLYSPSASSPPPHHLILPGRIRLLHPAGPPARPARANRLALTGSLCDSELLARPRPRAASRAIISLCLALLPPLAKPPPDTTSEAGFVAGCLSCCSTTRRCCSSRAHRLTTLGLGRESPTSAVGNKVHSQLPRCLTWQSVVTAPAPLLPLQPPSPPPRSR